MTWGEGVAGVLTTIPMRLNGGLPACLHASIWVRVGIPRAYMRPYGCV